MDFFLAAPLAIMDGLCNTGTHATSLDYSIRLASLTGDKGLLSTRFYGYQECQVELGQVAKRRGVNSLDRDKWILNQRNALS